MQPVGIREASLPRQEPSDLQTPQHQGKAVSAKPFGNNGLQAPFANVADDYCVGMGQGGGSCTWPVTEQMGNIVFQFDPQLLIAIGLQAPPTQQTFGMVITGDNDPSTDCHHENLQFQVTAKYYIQQ